MRVNWPLEAIFFCNCLIFVSFSLVIEEEKADSRAEVKTFDQSKLKHVEPQEKNTLPKQSGKCELF